MEAIKFPPLSAQPEGPYIVSFANAMLQANVTFDTYDTWGAFTTFYRNDDEVLTVLNGYVLSIVKFDTVERLDAAGIAESAREYSSTLALMRQRMNDANQSVPPWEMGDGEDE